MSSHLDFPFPYTMGSNTITFGTLAFPFSSDIREGLVEEEPGVLRFYPVGSYVETCEDEGDGPSRDSLTSSADSLEDLSSAAPAQAHPPPHASTPLEQRYQDDGFDIDLGRPHNGHEHAETNAHTRARKCCKLCNAEHSYRRCPSRCLKRSCARRRAHAAGTCHYRKRVCAQCGETGHGPDRCPSTVVGQV
jgi:hypothetical protein